VTGRELCAWGVAVDIEYRVFDIWAGTGSRASSTWALDSGNSNLGLNLVSHSRGLARYQQFDENELWSGGRGHCGEHYC
jgi:hypothetical protein